MKTWNDVVIVGNKYGYKEYNDNVSYIKRDSTLIPPTADLIFYSDGVITTQEGYDVVEGRTYTQIINILENLHGA